MAYNSQGSFISLAILLLAFTISYSESDKLAENVKNRIKSATFLSPKFVLVPGSVANKYYLNIEFPRGHIALKSFNAEVVDEKGNSIPLHETYLHHWLVQRYYQNRSIGNSPKATENFRFAGNTGICQADILRQYFGLGSETRKTATHIPDPFGIEIGNPDEIPEGYEEKWMLNVHAIDTRGVEDRLGCTECKCDLYNVTVDEDGRPLRPDYKGGLLCCYDRMQCKLRPGFEGVRRNLYLRYTVKWVDWDDSIIIPVKIFIFDVTDTGRRNGSGFGPGDGCQVEYEVKGCAEIEGCNDVKRTSLTMPTGGYVIYGVAHQHTGGIGSTLYGQDGRVICNSIPTYGRGIEAGNEAGYIVGMSTCYPEPGTVKIADGEKLILESNYSRNISHTGVMGLFYILVAENISSMPFLRTTTSHFPHVKQGLKQYLAASPIVLVGLIIATAITISTRLKRSIM